MNGSADSFDSLWQRREGLAQVPMHLVWGMKDHAFGPGFLEKWKATFPHARVTECASAGHWPQEEVPEVLTEVLLRRGTD